MISVDEVNREILRLENTANSYADCEKLSVLYNVRNNIYKPTKTNNTQIKSYSEADVSEFMEAARSTDRDKFLKVMDEHMEVIHVLYPKEYHAILDKLKG